jgi:hypothetical protein
MWGVVSSLIAGTVRRYGVMDGVTCGVLLAL